MSPRLGVRAVGMFLVAAPSLLTSAFAHAAVDKRTCSAAYEDAQRARKDGRLVAAREQLVICAQESCPDVAKKDCTQWMSEVDASTPTVVIEARGPDGRERLDVTVDVDGKRLATELGVTAISIDPGVHTFRYELAGSDPVEAKVAVREGEKNRKLLVTFSGPPVLAPPPRVPEAPTPSIAREVPVSAYIIGGVGVVALGSFTYFGLSGVSDENGLRASCAPACAKTDVDSVFTRYVVADVSLAVGVVALGVATWLFIARPGFASASEKSHARAPSFGRDGTGFRF